MNALVYLVFVTTIVTSGEQVFTAVCDCEDCPTALKIEWGKIEDKPETFKHLEECEKGLLVKHTFSSKAPRRIYITFYKGEDILDKSYLDVDFK